MQRKQLKDVLFYLRNEYEKHYPIEERKKYGFFNSPLPFMIRNIDLMISEASLLLYRGQEEECYGKILGLIDMIDSSLKTNGGQQKELFFYNKMMGILGPFYNETNSKRLGKSWEFMN